jgi:hypothetical protein
MGFAALNPSYALHNAHGGGLDFPNPRYTLTRWLPGGRYEFWVFQHDLYTDIESDALGLFRETCEKLPLANRRGGSLVQKHKYDDTLYAVAEQDRRYWWAIRPTTPEVAEYFEKGAVQGNYAP